MTSILTNMSALSALQSLSMTEASLATTQQQISTGMKVGTAADNAAYWSISTTMKSDNGALSSVSDALNIASATLGVASTAMTNVISVMDNIKNTLVGAEAPTTDFTKIQTAISAYQSQLQSYATASSFNGDNMLSINSGSSSFASTQSFVASFSRDTTGNITLGTISIDVQSNATLGTTGTALYDTTTSGTSSAILDSVSTTTGVSIATMNVSSLTSSTADTTSLQLLISQVDAAIQSITSANSTLGATQTRISLQSSFVSSLSTAISTGVGSLIDADMNDASTRLQALQVQQQLGIQALSIANQNNSLILKLFQ